MIFVGTQDCWKMPVPRKGLTVNEDNVCFAGPFANERDAISFAVTHDLDGFWLVRRPDVREDQNRNGFRGSSGGRLNG